MLIEQKEMTQVSDGIETIVRSYAFDSLDRVKLIPGHVHTVSKEQPVSEYLSNCFVAWVNNTPIIRSGSIDSQVKAEQLIALAREVHKEYQTRNASKQTPLRLCSNQVNSVEFEWDLIDLQHRHLLQAAQELRDEVSIVHLSHSLENFYAEGPQERKVKSVEEMLHKLPKLLNMEAWVSYCAWYNALLEEAFLHFPYDAADEYTLERYLKDFRHEVTSYFLKGTVRKLHELTVGSHRYNDLVKLEKEIIVLRNDIQRMVRAHYNDLAEIVKIIHEIKVAHPELVDLMHTGEVLQGLLANEVEASSEVEPNWAKKQVMTQLLNDDLGVISAINCEHGVDRTNIAFAIRLAVLQLKDTCGRRELLDRVFIRERVLSNLETFCVSITRLNTGGVVPQWHEGMRENPELLDFLPSHQLMMSLSMKGHLI